jgi:hypothetical protein
MGCCGGRTRWLFCSPTIVAPIKLWFLVFAACYALAPLARITVSQRGQCWRMGSAIVGAVLIPVLRNRALVEL